MAADQKPVIFIALRLILRGLSASGPQARRAGNNRTHAKPPGHGLEHNSTGKI